MICRTSVLNEYGPPKNFPIFDGNFLTNTPQQLINHDIHPNFA